MSEKIGEGAQKRYDEKMPVISFRVKNDMKEKIDKVVAGRGKYENKFSRQKYLYKLVEEDLNGLEL